MPATVDPPGGPRWRSGWPVRGAGRASAAPALDAGGGGLKPTLQLVARRFVLLAILGLLLRGWLVDGLLVPYEVTSGSMAPTLLGPHHCALCPACGAGFAMDATGPKPWRVLCPNCGEELAREPNPEVYPGEEILLDRAALLFRPPRRGELVAFRHPDRSSQVVVKRVVGLPGEQVQIREGDVFIDGRRQRKCLLAQRTLALPVHQWPVGDKVLRLDALGGPASRWGSVAPQEARAWSAACGQSPAAIRWYRYRHWLAVPDQPAVRTESPITDLGGYNPGVSRRHEEVARVVDLMLCLDLATPGRGCLLVRAEAGDGREPLIAEFRLAQGRWRVWQSGRQLAAGAGQPRRSPRIEVSLIDRQFLLALDGRTLWTKVLAPAQSAASTALSFGLDGSPCGLQRIRLLRDVYYTHPAGRQGRWGLAAPVHLGAQEYFVLGDNSPISDDSRSWSSGPALNVGALLGRPRVRRGFMCPLLVRGG